jgi:hypothetical protein
MAEIESLRIRINGLLKHREDLTSYCGACENDCCDRDNHKYIRSIRKRDVYNKKNCKKKGDKYDLDDENTYFLYLGHLEERLIEEIIELGIEYVRENKNTK